MRSLDWTVAASMILIVLGSTPASAQEEGSVGKWPPFHLLSETGGMSEFGLPRPSSMGPARDYRMLWGNEAVEDIVGRSENGWDFNRSGSAPGFTR